MTTPNDGGPAFPVQFAPGYTFPGMSLRDWFAGQALAGLAPADGYTTEHKDTPGEYARIATNAYAMADAMISTRVATKQPST